MAALELFHQIAHAPSAEVRRFMTEHALEQQLRLRNVAYPEVLADFQKHGGTELPAIWDGERLFSGVTAVVAQLTQLVDNRRDS